jgi:hypothetical protein
LHSDRKIWHVTRRLNRGPCHNDTS